MSQIKIDFIHCHDHSCHSRRDAHSRIDKLVARAKELGQRAVGLTDHGVLHGIPELFRECAKQGVKPIAGMEGYFTPEKRGEPSKHFHQLILVKNLTGWKNLLKISSEAFQSGFYGKPRFDWELLEKHHEGLILTSSCLAGQIPQLIMAGELKEARKVAKRFKEVFGEDYYLEVQPTNTPMQELVNKEIEKMSNELGIEVIATGDVHFVEPEDVKAHLGMLCLGRGQKMHEIKGYDGEENYYLKHGKEIFLDLRKQGFGDQFIIDAMNNTGKIADKVDFELAKNGDLLPEFPLPEGMDKDKLIGEMVKEGLMRKVPIKTKTYIERIQFELGVIREKGYQDYFLIVSDALKFCKSKNIMVNFGRGSGAGSLVAYLLDITEVDPIEHGLFFERFLDITRSKMPDIDTDIEDERRDEVLDYLKEKYGRSRVAQIINYGRMTAKLAFKNALMVYDIPFGASQEISNMIPDELGITIEKAYEMNPKLRALRTSKETLKANAGHLVPVKDIVDLAERFEFVIDKFSVHAGGILITPTDLSDYFPIYLPDATDKKRLVVQWDKDDIEQLGGVKFDFLGLKTLRTVGLALRSIEKEHGIKIDINKIAREHNDPATYERIGKGLTQNSFQFNSSGMQQLCKAVKPTEFAHLVAINALYRPPALASGDTWRYARIKNGEEAEHYSHPEERAITGETFGVITYQEHVMQLVHYFANWDYGYGDKLRKMNSEQLEGLREKFIEDARSEWGWARESLFCEQMNEIWDRIVRYMGYGFNKSHGVAYTMLSYVTVWLETHYPEHYMSAIMSTKMGDQDKFAQVFGDVKKSGFDFQAPDINKSDELFTAFGGKIVFPLGMINGVGDTAVEEIMKHKPFSSLEDLMERVNKRVVSARAMKPLVLAGAFDEMYPDKSRHEVLLHYYQLKGEGKKKLEELKAEPWSDEIQAEHEKKLLGVYLTTHPLAKYHFRDWKEYQEGDQKALIGGAISKVKSFNDKKGNRMAFVTVDTLEGAREVVVFAQTFKKFEGQIKEKAMVMCEGKKDGEKLLANKFKELV